MTWTIRFLALIFFALQLLACGARSDATTPEMAQSMLKLRGYHYTEAELFRALKLGDGVAVKGFLQGGMDPNSMEQDRETALTFAIQKNDLPIIKLLLEYADINLRDGLGNSPIHLSIKERKPEVFKLLMDRNADVNVPGRGAGLINDQTVLYLAVARNDAAVVRELLERGANPNMADSAGSLALTEAVVDSDAKPEIVEMLLEKGADVNRAEPVSGATALIFIAQNNRVSSAAREKIVKMLLAKGADKTIKETDGKTAMYWARLKRNEETVKLLQQ